MELCSTELIEEKIELLHSFRLDLRDIIVFLRNFTHESFKHLRYPLLLFWQNPSLSLKGRLLFNTMYLAGIDHQQIHIVRPQVTRFK